MDEDDEVKGCISLNKALLEAVRSGDMQTVQKALDLGADPKSNLVRSFNLHLSK
jgi:ankyrin repeat protein